MKLASLAPSLALLPGPSALDKTRPKKNLDVPHIGNLSWLKSTHGRPHFGLAPVGPHDWSHFGERTGRREDGKVKRRCWICKNCQWVRAPKSFLRFPSSPEDWFHLLRHWEFLG